MQRMPKIKTFCSFLSLFLFFACEKTYFTTTAISLCFLFLSITFPWTVHYYFSYFYLFFFLLGTNMNIYMCVFRFLHRYRTQKHQQLNYLRTQHSRQKRKSRFSWRHSFSWNIRDVMKVATLNKMH